MTQLDYVVDHATGIAIVRPHAAFSVPSVQGIGLLTYRCHTCGELIPKHWEVFYADPLTGWASPVAPAEMPASMTTHHDWHMAATQEA